MCIGIHAASQLGRRPQIALSHYAGAGCYCAAQSRFSSSAMTGCLLVARAWQTVASMAELPIHLEGVKVFEHVMGEMGPQLKQLLASPVAPVSEQESVPKAAGIYL